MNCRRGDVVLVLFPDSNLRTSKRRPALVVQADQLGTGLPQTIVAMITSNMARAGHPSRVVVRADSEGAQGSGLLMDSVIMTDHLATIQHSQPAPPEHVGPGPNGSFPLNSGWRIQAAGGNGSLGSLPRA
jgi:mRNA interferase MazF